MVREGGRNKGRRKEMMTGHIRDGKETNKRWKVIRNVKEIKEKNKKL
jgi:hypothetical protein